MMMAAIRPGDHQARYGEFLVPGPSDRLVPSWERDHHGHGDGEDVLELVLQAEASLVCCSADLAAFVKCFQRQHVWGSQIHSSSQNQLMIVRSPKNVSMTVQKNALCEPKPWLTWTILNWCLVWKEICFQQMIFFTIVWKLNVSEARVS